MQIAVLFAKFTDHSDHFAIDIINDARKIVDLE